MTITAYTTSGLSNENLAIAVGVMDAYREGGKDFPQNLNARSAIESAVSDGTGHKITINMLGLSSNVDMNLHQGSAEPIIIKLDSGLAIDTQITTALSNTKQKPAPKKGKKPTVSTKPPKV